MGLSTGEPILCDVKMGLEMGLSTGETILCDVKMDWKRDY